HPADHSRWAMSFSRTSGRGNEPDSDVAVRGNPPEPEVAGLGTLVPEAGRASRGAILVVDAVDVGRSARGVVTTGVAEAAGANGAGNVGGARPGAGAETGLTGSGAGAFFGSATGIICLGARVIFGNAGATVGPTSWW